uniref:F-box domain-containing protein n=1 Tax=Monopterus albus TaxID=43700 RepID=A0A3Q3JBB2_MONAL|nr:F-box only protein 15-like [Monopterus albus]
MPRSASGNEYSPQHRKVRKRRNVSKMKTYPSGENTLERLPPEILIKILSYLDASSLFCISHVNKLFHKLGNNDDMWRRIYMSDFGRYIWKPKSDDAVFKEDPVEVETQSMDHWKKCYFRTVAGQDISKWLRKLKDTKPRTGLPILTECALRNMNVKWELTVANRWGHKITQEQSQAYFLDSSVVVHWSSPNFPAYCDISNIQLHGVRKDTQATKPGWCSLILKLDMSIMRGWLISQDKLICLRHLSSGVLIGVWRGNKRVAFIMACLHFHKLVQKSLLGTPCIPYSEPVDRLPLNDSDPEPGLHNYSLNFVLHSSNTKFMTGYYHELSCHNAQTQEGMVELRVIRFSKLFQHKLLCGNAELLWKSEMLEGALENCCIMTLTLQDECQKPFWCISTPIAIKKVKSKASDYSESHFQMIYWDSDGKVKVTLVWLEEQKRLMVISLTVYISVVKINKRFSTLYGTSA